MADSTQKKLERVRPPRIQISYEVDTGSAMEMKELPFLMGVLGDFSGQPTEPLPKLKERKFVEVTPDNFDDVLASMKPHLGFTVENKLDPTSDRKLGVDLHFRSLDDFSPEAVARQVTPLRELLELRTQLADLRGSLQTNDRLDEVLQATLGDAAKMDILRAAHEGEKRKAQDAAAGTTAAASAPSESRPMAEARAAGQSTTAYGEAGPSLLDQIVDQGKLGRDPETKERNKDLVKRFVAEVLEGSITVGRDTEAMINARIAQIDRLLSEQLNEILHHPAFQKLEASWRGLKYLLAQSETGTMLKIKILNVSKQDLLKDLKNAPEFDQSALFKKVYEEEYGVFGGTPFGAMVGDYTFGKSGPDVELLEKVSQVAAAAHAPFLTSAGPDMFNLDSFAELDQPRDLGKVFDTTEFAKWKAFRQKEDSRYVALTAPRILMREPYGAATVPIEAFNYEEDVDGTDHAQYLWGSSAYALAANVNKAFALYGWCASIRGVESGGLVEGLPVHNFRTDAGELVMKCPTEVQITDRREKELAELGFVPLVHQKGTPNAAFFSVQSAQRPKVYDQPAATASARLSAQLPYIFATARFAHYLKVMMRDKIGGYMTRGETESFLNTWINNYVALENAPPMTKAKKPLSDARIDVMEVPGKPGVYRAVAFLKPHYQLDELSVSMRLVAELPPPAA